MAQRAYVGKAMIHPSEVIEVWGDTAVGRRIEIFLSQESADKLAAALVFADKHDVHRGHAFWHISNDEPEPCPQCKKIV